MLTRQKLWVAAAKHSPKYFPPFSASFVSNDISSREAIQAIGITPADMLVLPVPNPRAAQPPTPEAPATVSGLFAIPFKVTEAACDEGAVTGGTEASHRRISDGFVVKLVDTVTSFHIMDRLTPQPLPHVSINITNQTLMPGVLVPGMDVVMVCTVEKLGKRIAYTSADFYLDIVKDGGSGMQQQYAGALTPELEEAEANVKCLADVQFILTKFYKKAIHATHVKAIANKPLTGAKD